MEFALMRTQPEFEGINEFKSFMPPLEVQMNAWGALSGTQGAVTDHDVRVIHGKGDAVLATWKDSEIVNFVRRVPHNGVPVSAGACAVRLADDDAGGVDRIRHAGDAAGKRAEVGHGRSVPEKTMRFKWRAVAEYGLTNDVAVVVDVESSGKNGFG